MSKMKNCMMDVEEFCDGYFYGSCPNLVRFR